MRTRLGQGLDRPVHAMQGKENEISSVGVGRAFVQMAQ
jgi:hypothetical protein